MEFDHQHLLAINKLQKTESTNFHQQHQQQHLAIINKLHENFFMIINNFSTSSHDHLHQSSNSRKQNQHLLDNISTTSSNFHQQHHDNISRSSNSRKQKQQTFVKHEKYFIKNFSFVPYFHHYLPYILFGNPYIFHILPYI